MSPSSQDRENITPTPYNSPQLTPELAPTVDGLGESSEPSTSLGELLSSSSPFPFTGILPPPAHPQLVYAPVLSRRLPETDESTEIGGERRRSSGAPPGPWDVREPSPVRLPSPVRESILRSRRAQQSDQRGRPGPPPVQLADPPRSILRPSGPEERPLPPRATERRVRFAEPGDRNDRRRRSRAPSPYPGFSDSESGNGSGDADQEDGSSDTGRGRSRLRRLFRDSGRTEDGVEKGKGKGKGKDTEEKEERKKKKREEKEKKKEEKKRKKEEEAKEDELDDFDSLILNEFVVDRVQVNSKAGLDRWMRSRHPHNHRHREP
ncbi:hypothetical protein GGS26DRAFT_594861 [Hypomontagnella submonticulosa]|nr:hypothetical protein GGS26DRAFT_594861 [Hypomontagnella submonticulosa]